MNAFPSDYVDHNLPLLLLSGLEAESSTDTETADHSKVLLREGGFRIKTDIPPVSGSAAEALRDAFLESDASAASWNGRAVSVKEYAGGYRIKSVGRTYTLPPRKAPPPPHSPRLSPTREGPPAPLLLHSTISPLTPSSPLYPDGVITPIWIQKHQTQLPAIFMTIFFLTADANRSSLQDNLLKSEINNIRNVISSTHYKTKLVVVLLGDSAIAASSLDERISNIRRFCTLDAKSLYYLPAESSQVEISEFVYDLLSALHPICIEYYRDLSKHTRRKRNRGSAPLPTIAPTRGTSHVLPTQGWNTRYEFKLGVLAEFRQEMDAACRNYESAYESLFSPDLLESIPSLSPRFNEAMLLADIIALRIIRCQLWTEQPTGAVRSWRNHRDRIRGVIERKGKGTGNYEWEAWESIWSKVMAEMIARVDLIPLSMLDSQTHHFQTIFAPPEKVLPLGERVAPWEFLHHAGYWFAIATKHTRRRKELALRLSEEDRKPPVQPPASTTANEAHANISYIAPEPHMEHPFSGSSGYDYHRDLSGTLKAAVESFAARGQLRTTERLQLEEATDLLDEDAWTDAAKVLNSLWKKTQWRKAGWWDFLSKIGWALFHCASKSNDHEIVLGLVWELSSCVFPARSAFNYDLHTVFDDLAPAEFRPAVVLSGDEVASSVQPTFTFAKAEGNVGQPLLAQFCLTGQLQTGAARIRFAEVKLVFEGGLRPVHILHEDDIAPSEAKAQIVSIDLQDSSTLAASSKKRSSAGAMASLAATADLSIGTGQTKVFTFSMIPREAGDVKIASITMIIDDVRFSLTVVLSDLADSAGYWWEMMHSKPVKRSFGMERDVTEVKILPKPPMVRIHAPNLKQAYYTNEALRLPLEIINDEEEAARISIHARLISPRAHAASLKWTDEEGAARPASESEIGVLVLPDRDLGVVAPSGSISLTILMGNTLDALDHEMEIVARYHTTLDPDTPLIKVSSFDLPFVRPFEANYSFNARYHEEAWPNFFEAPGPHEVTAAGLKQIYLVKSSLYSFANEDLEIESANLVIHRAAGGAVCDTTPGRRKPALSTELSAGPAAISNVIAPEETQDICFDLRAQKTKLGDRRVVGLDMTLEVTWRRPGAAEKAVSTLEIPRFVAPMAEPRVLLTDALPLPRAPASSGLAIYQLQFILENPSMHFLTFNLTLESSEDYAFSGWKAASVSLVPVSRHTVMYRLLLSKTAIWTNVNLAVVDAYFGKQLRVLPAGDGVKSDKKGNISVWIP